MRDVKHCKLRFIFLITMMLGLNGCTWIKNLGSISGESKSKSKAWSMSKVLALSPELIPDAVGLPRFSIQPSSHIIDR